MNLVCLENINLKKDRHIFKNKKRIVLLKIFNSKEINRSLTTSTVMNNMLNNFITIINDL